MKKAGIITLAVLGIFLIAREQLPFEVSWYRTHSLVESSDHHNNRTMSIPGLTFRPDRGVTHLDSIDRYVTHYPDFDGWEGYQQSDSVLQVTVSVVNDMEMSDRRFLPLVKQVDFSSDISYQWSEHLHRDSIRTVIEFSGTIDVTGHIEIYGICSGQTAGQLIKKLVRGEVTKYVDGHVASQINAL